ncbi:type II toxin-antitoxin system RelE/ParE family toxin (plasmid) [Deinococcus radiomollis]|uniref:type II toxin-antitoxin system RelE/ParE family toxin n=1 Tax=Deinococcus radiomollis TaxID=468916 RepID=UPI003892B6DD
MAWDVVLLSEVVDWYKALDDQTAELVTAAIDLLAELGPTLGRPLVDTLRGGTLANLKELRPGSAGNTELRVLFAFDPRRQAVLLTAGNKGGQWKTWYAVNIPLAEQRYADWLRELPPIETTKEQK